MTSRREQRGKGEAGDEMWVKTSGVGHQVNVVSTSVQYVYIRRGAHARVVVIEEDERGEAGDDSGRLAHFGGVE